MKVLIVEDDKLVRKGLISAMPWQDYDMEVVGEAKNGKDALEFINSNDVDFVLTDLTMPIMSGIELMKIVKDKYPTIYFVILTFHQEFEYIQQALRLGAIDFISKVELEKEHFNEVLARIHNLITQKERISNHINEKVTELFSEDCGYALMSKEENAEIDWVNQIVGNSSNSFQEIGDLVWFGLLEDKIAKNLAGAKLNSGWTMMKVTEIRGQNRNDVFQKLRKYKKCSFFYEYLEDQKVITKSLHDICSIRNSISKETFLEVKERWLSFEWVSETSTFTEMKQELKDYRLSITKLFSLINDIGNAWNEVHKHIDNKMIVKVPETLNSWYDTEQWLIKIVDSANQFAINVRYSQEVIHSIMSAIKIIQEEVNQPLFAVDVAKRVNMSRSYFNQCFKDITGRSFNDYLRNLRIEIAKDYLTKTNKTILWIAEQTGYKDEKYFSRVFRQKTSKTPSEYRKSKC
ncbi:response regulator transcription factor [Aquibacillus albus]|uniref:Two-component system response regulator YesN n=1 Tax=Aquibacillus albus TaxID=1168171 RepID=A0ABS2MW26_9BACI|nr:response regulator [Aquibacillus albus]MBM7570095.1 two-component system response regulator YesN [Aquibacillus albus]